MAPSVQTKSSRRDSSNGSTSSGSGSRAAASPSRSRSAAKARQKLTMPHRDGGEGEDDMYPRQRDDHDDDATAFAPKFIHTPRTPPSANVGSDSDSGNGSRSRSRSRGRTPQKVTNDAPSRPVGGGGSAADITWSTSVSQLVTLPVAKMSLQLCLTALNVGCWLVPLQSQTFSSNTSLLALASCYSAGVFLSLALTHLLPGSIDGLTALESSEDGKNNARKLALVACLGGYLLVLWLEKVAFFSIHHDIESSSSSGGAGGSSSSSSSNGEEGDSHSAKVLLFAMSVHSLLETLALGLSKDTSAAVMMAASIGLHQPAETLALLVSFLKTGMSHANIIIYLSIFSVVGPLSVLLGIIISKTADPKLDSIIVAITAGTFIYMACTEIANEEFPGGEVGMEVTLDMRYQRLGAIVAGIATILGLAHISEGWEER